MFLMASFRYATARATSWPRKWRSFSTWRAGDSTRVELALPLLDGLGFVLSVADGATDFSTAACWAKERRANRRVAR